MARKVSGQEPALSIDFFTSGFYTYRSQLFAPFKGIGVNVVSFHDPVIDGQNMELTDKLQWTRRYGFSIFCSQALADSEIVNQFYSSRNLNGVVIPFVDTTMRLATFSPTAITTVFPKTTKEQGFVLTIGNLTYFADGAGADYGVWDGTNEYAWGLAPPTVLPSTSGMGFWQPDVKFPLGSSILDPNGDLETVTAILIPNGAFESPTEVENMALAGSLTGAWTPDNVYGGYSFVEGYREVQKATGYSGNSTTATLGFGSPVTVGNVIIVEIGDVTLNFIPSVVSVTDELGNVYTQQATATGTFHAGGGNNYANTAWVFSAPVTVGGLCTVTVTLNDVTFQIAGYEVQGISATASTTANDYAINSAGAFNSGTATFSGTQFVLSTLLLSSPVSAGTPPVGYTPGNTVFGAAYLQDAYFGQTTTASPTWGVPPADNLSLGITTVFPITTLGTGYTPYLFLYSFENAVPTGATIVGIQVSIPKFNSAQGAVQDHVVSLVIGGAVVGTNEASATVWSSAGYATALYGGTDTWGLSPTPAQLNANGTSGFGVVISADITSVANGSVVPQVGFTAPNQPTVTIYYQNSSGKSEPGISGNTEPIWPTNLGSSVNDGGITWTDYGSILTWLPATAYPTPAVILDLNGFLQLATSVVNTVPEWNAATTYSAGEIVFYGAQYWIYINNTPTAGIVPSTLYSTATTAGATTTTTPYWAITPNPLTTGLEAPDWNTAVGGTTTDGSYTWTNIGQGTALAFIGYAYVYAYRTVYGHLTTASPFSANTGAILGPVNATITSFSITGNVITFIGANNFLPGNIFQVSGLTSPVGQTLNNQSFTVTSAFTSQTLELTTEANTVQIAADVLTVQVVNSLVPGQQVTFTNVATATFLNGLTFTVATASPTQFTAAYVHANYDPATDSGMVDVIGSYSANYTHANVGATSDAGASLPLIASLSGLGTASPLCNATATITAVSVTADIVTLTAANNFQPGIWVTVTGLTNATFLNNQQVQVIAVSQPIGTENTYFQVYFVNPNYTTTTDSGTATFNAIEIYRTSDGGGSYLFDGAVTNPAPSLGIGTVWNYNDFVPDANLDILLVAPLAHQNDPPPSAPGSLITTVTGTILTYWQGRIWMAAGNYVYFDAGPDCTNGIPEQAWPPSNRFQYPGPVLGIEKTSDGGALIVYLADRLAIIQGGPETISFYSTDLLSNFGISTPNAVFRDSQTLGQFTTQSQYIELVNVSKDDIGAHIGDYLAANFSPTKSYATLHRNGLDVGVFLSNGVDRILRFGSNISAWSVPAFPPFGAGALNSIETSVGVYTLMVASPTGGVTGGAGSFNPTSAISVAGSGVPWLTPANVVIGNPATYATATFTGDGTSQILRVSAYPVTAPATAVIQGVTLTLLGKQNVSTDFTVTVKPTIAGGTSHTFQFGSTNTSVMLGNSLDLWGISSWAQPGNLSTISFDITATYTGLAPGSTGIYGAFDQSASNNGVGATATVGPVTPAAAGEIALVIGQASSGSVGTPSGWAVLNNSSAGGSGLGVYVQIQPTAAPFTYSQSLGSSLTWDALLVLFAATATSFTGSITEVALTSNVVTVTCANDFIVGTQVICSGLTGAAFLNAAVLTILAQSPTQFTAAFTHVDYAPTADSGTATDVGVVQVAAETPGNFGTRTLTLTNPVTPGNTVLVVVQGIDSGGFGVGHANITSLAGSTIAPASWTTINTESSSGNKPAANLAYVQNVTSGDSVTVTVQNSLVGCRWAVIEVAGGVDIPDPVMSIAQAQLIVTYQNPGNYLYARDLNSYGDDGNYGLNNGTPYPFTNVVIGNITLSQPGAAMFALQHVVGYFDAVGTLNAGEPSTPNVWILPNEVSATTGGSGFILLPENLPEPPEGQNTPSQTILARRWPLNMMNSNLASQFIHHLQVKIQFEPENVPNTIKAISFKEDQS